MMMNFNELPEFQKARLFCRYLKGGSILVRIDGTERETHIADFELKNIEIISALETLKLMRHFDECKSKRIEELEEENSKLNNRIRKLLDAKF